MNDEAKNLHLISADDIIKLSERMANFEPINVGEVPVLALPRDYEIHELEHTLAFDARKKPDYIIAKEELENSISLADYIGHHVTEKTAIHFCRKDANIGVCFDDNHNGIPGTNEHTAYTNFKKTREYENWKNIEDKSLSHIDLLDFFDDNSEDIVSPAYHDLINMLKTLRVVSNSERVTDLKRNSGGYTFSGTNSEDLGEECTLPEEIKIGVHIYEHERDQGTELWPITFKVKAKIRDGKLNIKLTCPRIELVERKAFANEKQRFLDELAIMVDIDTLQVYDV